MKASPEFLQAQEKMKPGVLTSDGFFGNDSRPLVDIIAADETSMQHLGITFENAAEKLIKLIAAARPALGNCITVDNTWEVCVDEARGGLPCPFRDGLYSKGIITVTNRDSGKALVFTDLSFHLFSKHHFLQGNGSRFRIEPKDLKAVLDL
ncbi:MAG: hypothetical protein JW904_15440 [Spirochaetales bacterium]|nr:hypothetical protein [Spirochaetales bacterium]